MDNFLKKIRKKKQVILYMTLIFASLSFLVATLIPPKYRSDIEILIIQNNSDAFSASKGVSYLSDVFTQVVHTETFFSDVLSSDFGIENNFSDDPKKRRKQWESEVKISKVDDTGIVSVSVFDVSKSQAEKIAGAIGWNFLENGKKYYGDTNDVIVKIIDGPITTSTPAYPDVFLSALLGGIAGLFSSLVIIFFYEPFDVVGPKRAKEDKKMVEIQIKRQLEEREIKKELDYKEPSPDDFYDFSKEEDIEDRSKKILEEAESAKFEKMPEMQTKKEDKEDREDPSVKRSFLDKLYGKSIFSDKKFAEKEKERLEKDRLHQLKRDQYAKDIDSADNVKKVVLENNEKETELRMWKPGGAKAPAPENLPVFLDEIDEKVPGDESEEKFEKKTEEDDVLIQDALAQEPLKKHDKHNVQGEVSSEFLVKKETNKQEAEKNMQRTNNISDIDFEREPTDEEVKERLNKLLKGEL